MRVRQSDIQAWQRCPLAYRFSHVDNYPRKQSSALTFGTIVHHCVLLMEEKKSLNLALSEFQRLWENPTDLDPEMKIEEWLKHQNFAKLRNEGDAILRNWWDLIQWDTDVVVAREHKFLVPIGDHELTGTVDKVTIRWRKDINDYALTVSDYKTTRKVPKYDYLNHDIQFTAYSYATTQPEFWNGIVDGDKYFERFEDQPRFGEWVHLQKTKRMDAGIRTDMHYARLEFAIRHMAMSIGLGIFVPNISGETCAYCEFRDRCGITPEYMT